MVSNPRVLLQLRYDGRHPFDELSDDQEAVEWPHLKEPARWRVRPNFEDGLDARYFGSTSLFGAKPSWQLMAVGLQSC